MQLKHIERDVLQVIQIWNDAGVRPVPWYLLLAALPERFGLTPLKAADALVDMGLLRAAPMPPIIGSWRLPNGRITVDRADPLAGDSELTWDGPDVRVEVADGTHTTYRLTAAAYELLRAASEQPTRAQRAGRPGRKPRKPDAIDRMLTKAENRGEHALLERRWKDLLAAHPELPKKTTPNMLRARFNRRKQANN